MPTNAELNALAAVDLTGDFFRNTQFETRWNVQRAGLVDELPFDVEAIAKGTYKRFTVSDAGRQILAKSKLHQAAQALIAAGFELNPDRRAKPGFSAWRKIGTTGRRTLETAFISDGRAYVYEPRPTAEFPHRTEAVQIFPAS